MSADVDDYQRRATEHRPRGIEELRAAIHRMRDEGLGEHSIGEALGLHVDAVRRLAGACPDCE